MVVLPEVDPSSCLVQIDAKDVVVEVMRASGAGGQHVNTTESAVRVTHSPSGISIRIQDERSQHQNREKAFRVLQARLEDRARAAAREERGLAATSQLGSGDRSEKIRTYNYKDGRVTDHRVGLTLYKLHEVLGGDLGELSDALVQNDLRERMQRVFGGAMG